MALNLKKRSSSNGASVGSGEGPSLSVVSEDVEKTRSATRKPDDTVKRKLKAYHQINQLFLDAGHDVKALSRDFLELAVEVLDGKGGSLWLTSEEGKSLSCRVATGPDSSGLAGATIPLGTGIVGWVGEKKKGTLVQDTTKDSRFKTRQIESSTPIRQTLLAAPLLHRGQLLGVVEIVDRTSGIEFAQSDLSFLNSLCVPAALNLHTSELLHSQGELIGRFDAIKNVQEAFSSTMELDALLALVMTKAIDLLGAEVGSIWLTEDSGDGIECKIAEGPTKDKVIGVKVKRGSGLIGWVVEHSKSEIIADCSKDSRFSAAMDKKIGFETRSMLAAPLCVKGECIGAIQIINKRERNQLFSSPDLEFLQLFAGNAAMYIKNARLFSAEKKAKELGALLRISGEITSTLDLDAVLMSIVNLSSDVIPYDRAAISTVRKGTENELVVRAVSGLERIDSESGEAKTLVSLHAACASAKGEISVMSRADLESTELPVEVRLYMEARQLESFWACQLKDDQGILGLFTMESKSPALITAARKELLTLLVNQSTVALRNADLYSTIPGAMRIGELKSRGWNALVSVRTWSPKKHALVWTVVAGVFSALIFVRVPKSVSTAVEIIPIAITSYAETQGKVIEVLVKEGEEVEKGQLLARLDATEARIQRDEKNATRMKLKAEMIRLLNEDKVADAKIKEHEMSSLALEVARLDRQIEKSDVRSQVDGLIVSEGLRDLIGKPLSTGQEIIRVARLDRVVAEFQVPEENVVFVKTGQTLKFKVFGFPQTTFGEAAKLESVAGEGKPLTEGAAEKFFVARAEISNKGEQNLRPGMTGRGRISGESQPLWYAILETPLRFVLNKLAF